MTLIDLIQKANASGKPPEYLKEPSKPIPDWDFLSEVEHTQNSNLWV